MKVTVSQCIDVELSQHEAERVASRVLREAAGLPIDSHHNSFSIENEYVLSHHTMHDGTQYTSRLRVASDTDIAAVMALTMIKK